MAELRWYANAYIRDLNRHIEQTMRKIVIYLEGQVKKNISRGNITGANPSGPGEFPKVRTGTLRANVSHDVTSSGGKVTGVVGVRKGLANRYAPSLEIKGLRDGTTRPFLRPTILQNRVRILKMLR